LYNLYECDLKIHLIISLLIIDDRMHKKINNNNNIHDYYDGRSSFGRLA